MHLELSTIQLQQLLSIYIFGSEFWDMLFQVEAHEPAGHLLGVPLCNTAVLPLVLLRQLTLI